MSKVIRVGGEFAKSLAALKKEYSKALGRKIKDTDLTNQLNKVLKREGYIDFLLKDARRRQR